MKIGELARRRRGSCPGPGSRRAGRDTSGSRASPAGCSGARGATTCRRRLGSSTSASPIRSCSSLPRPWWRTSSPCGSARGGSLGEGRGASSGSVVGDWLVDSISWPEAFSTVTSVPMARLLAAAQVVMLARRHWQRLAPHERRRLLSLRPDDRVAAHAAGADCRSPSGRAGAADRQGRPEVCSPASSCRGSRRYRFRAGSFAESADRGGRP